MSTNFRISIHKPCSANWCEMTPEAQGRFCGLCNHTVVDFTKMSDAEIKEYFQRHANQKTCGRFRTTQLSYNKRKSFSMKAVLMGCITLLAFMMGCRKPPHHKMGKVAMDPTMELKEKTK